jgi:hypothetical protein
MKQQITEGFAQDSTDVLASGTTFFSAYRMIAGETH